MYYKCNWLLFKWNNFLVLSPTLWYWHFELSFYNYNTTDEFQEETNRPSKHSSWWRHLEDVFKTSSRHLQDVLQRYLQDVFKAYHQVKLFLLTRLREVFNTFLRRSFPKTVIYRGIFLGNTTSEKCMVSVQNLQER